MGKCTYCGNSAGLFRRFHSECRDSFEKGLSRMTEKVADTIEKGTDLNDLISSLREICLEHRVPETSIKDKLIEGWGRALDRFLDDSLLTEEEEGRLSAFKSHFDLSDDDLDPSGALTKAAQAAALRDIVRGVMPHRPETGERIPFTLKRGEEIVWLFPDVHYYVQKTDLEYLGGSSTIGVRVADGVYFHPGAFRGKPLKTDETVHLGSGTMGVATKHLYFTGERITFRIPYRKIICCDQHEDGLCVTRYGPSAKPQIFRNGEGWFVYNLVRNIAKT
ncbi:MAG: hypothetical protein JSV26_09225 [bacterium]|nr:MAG: hypothetical protein JSV26_09225 [bacterium]